MSRVEIGLEIVRLIGNLLVALVVARFAVTWALGRYKSEKIWERQLTAFADAVTAISEMRRLNLVWYDIVSGDLRLSEDASTEQAMAYRQAKRKVEEVISIGLLLLPPATQQTLADLYRNIDRDDLAVNEWLDAMSLEANALDEALAALIKQGQPLLGVAGKKQIRGG